MEGITVTGSQWVVIAGDPVAGFGYHGPFSTRDGARAYGDLHRGNAADEYGVAPLQQLHTPNNHMN